MPHSGRAVKELEGLDLREVIFKNYRIAYRVVGSEEEIQILAVLHAARDFTKTVDEDWIVG